MNILKLVLIAGLFLSCGLEEYYFLNQVPEENITYEMNNAATIEIPGSSLYYATHYSIFYRIYISDHNLTGEIPSTDFARINPSLSQDYNAILPSTDPVNTSANTAIGNLFRNRQYHELVLEDENIKEILSRTSKTIRLDFYSAPRDIPTLTVAGGAPINLLRSNGESTFQPEPEDRYFRNMPELYDNEKATSGTNTTNNINADVAANAANPGEYTYVSMYIVLVGMDPDNFFLIYSKPTFIGIFRLP